MTTMMTLPECKACGFEFTPAENRRGPKPTICSACLDRFRNLPEQESPGLCRICRAPAREAKENEKRKYQADTFCPECFAIYRKVYLRDAKRKERAGLG